jgi:hypothetical protein
MVVFQCVLFNDAVVYITPTIAGSVNMEWWFSNTGNSNPEYSSRCHFVHHKFHMDQTEMEHFPARREVDYPHMPWNSHWDSRTGVNSSVHLYRRIQDTLF